MNSTLSEYYFDGVGSRKGRCSHDPPNVLPRTATLVLPQTFTKQHSSLLIALPSTAAAAAAHDDQAIAATMANYRYDEAGNMAAYFVITFLALVLVPLTLSLRSGSSKLQ